MSNKYTNDDTFLARWLENKLTEKELADFEQSEDYELLKKIASKSQQFSVPVFDQEKTLKEIKAKIATRKTKTRRLIPVWAYTVAASLFILIGLSYFFNQETKYSTTGGQQMACVLPDGSQVELNGNTILSFREKDWEKGDRTLNLEGEAYFKVKKGSLFSVATKNGTVGVLGTQFNVQTIKDFLAVECYEGKVVIKNSKLEEVLTPGKGVQFLTDKKLPYNIDVSEPNWLLKDYKYNAVPLRVVFRDLENLYKITVKNKDVNLDKKYSGILVKGDLEKALKIICKSMNIKHSLTDKEVIIFN